MTVKIGPYDDLMEAQSEVTDILNEATSLTEHLECAMSCETEDDYRANIANAHESVKRVERELADLIRLITGKKRKRGD